MHYIADSNYMFFADYYNEHGAHVDINETHEYRQAAGYLYNRNGYENLHFICP